MGVGVGVDVILTTSDKQKICVHVHKHPCHSYVLRYSIVNPYIVQYRQCGEDACLIAGRQRRYLPSPAGDHRATVVRCPVSYGTASASP